MLPVEKIELSSAHPGRRMALAAAFLVLAVCAFVYGVMQLVGTEDGWQQISATGGGLSSAGELALQYDVSSASGRREVTALYTQAAQKAYQLFEPTAETDSADVHGIAYLNAHPNEPVQVDPALYAALEQIQSSGERSLYLGPVTAYYGNIFFCTDDGAEGEYDPMLNDDVRKYFARCAAFAADPEAVDIRLMGEDTVELAVSEQYLAFAQEQQADRFLDFGWMKNAFVVDFIADELTAGGCTNGVLTSYDGFVRNLGGSGEMFRLDILDRGGRAAYLEYTGALSAVSLRGYPLYDQDAQRFYVRQDGQLRGPYLDPADGLPRAAAEDLLVYAKNLTCGELALLTGPAYASDSLTGESLAALRAAGAETVRCEGGQVLCSDPAAVTAEAGQNGTALYAVVPEG